MRADMAKGLAVVSIADGGKLGRVADVLFDTRNLRVAALRIEGDGGRALIPLIGVRSIGHDAVTVPSAESVEWAAPAGDEEGLIGADQLGRLKVVDEAGTFHGVVSHVEVDDSSGRLIEIQAQKGGVLGLGGTTHVVAAREVITIGDELIVVRAADAPSVATLTVAPHAAKPESRARPVEDEVLVVRPGRARPDSIERRTG
jgi:uncharacterized protein YrrD